MNPNIQNPKNYDPVLLRGYDDVEKVYQRMKNFERNFEQKNKRNEISSDV